MKELDCDYLATGHYAKIVYDEKGKASIHTSTDDWKDQTYFLFTIEPELVPKLLFPVGDMKKPEVRAYSESRGLVTAKKKILRVFVLLAIKVIKTLSKAKLIKPS